jgi:hypothetical protein
MIVSVGRSPLRALGFALLAAPMILLAVDMAFSHRWFPAPDSAEVVVARTTDAAGNTIDVTEQQLTNDGHAQRRRDLIWSGALFAGGALAAAFSLRELFLPTKVVTADQQGLSVRIFGARKAPVRYSWVEIERVRSGVVEDEAGPIEVLSLRLADPVLLPERPVGAYVDPPWLHLMADDWDRPPHLIAPMIEGWISGFGRAEQYG